MTPRVILRYDNQSVEEPEIEWYSGSELHTRPKRIRINGVWKETFGCEKSVRENICRKREIAFRCHIGDNRFVEVVIQAMN